MADQDHVIVIKSGDQEDQYTLAELGNIDITDVERFRMTVYKFPIGVYLWEVKLSESRVMGGKTCMFTAFTCVGVLECADEKIDPSELLGKEHAEMVFMPIEEGKKPTMEDLNKWFGMYKDLLMSIKAQASGKINDIQKQIVGHKFQAPITHQFDRKKPNVYYSRFDLDACTAVEEQKQQTQVA